MPRTHPPLARLSCHGHALATLSAGSQLCYNWVQARQDLAVVDLKVSCFGYWDILHRVVFYPQWNESSRFRRSVVIFGDWVRNCSKHSTQFCIGTISIFIFLIGSNTFPLQRVSTVKLAVTFAFHIQFLVMRASYSFYILRGAKAQVPAE